jgi:hypothetical protein
MTRAIFICALGFGHWSLFVIWGLLFGASPDTIVSNSNTPIGL